MKYVSFTFDDGRRDNFTCAYAARNFAHLYVVSGRQHSMNFVVDKGIIILV